MRSSNRSHRKNLFIFYSISSDFLVSAQWSCTGDPARVPDLINCRSGSKFDSKENLGCCEVCLILILKNAEPVWQMGLGATEESYPQRPGEADCIYYLRIGFCGYGSRCRFNHPCDRVEAVGAVARTGGGEYPERIGQPLCQYYMKIGSCKFGSCFKYNHPGQVGGSIPYVTKL